MRPLWNFRNNNSKMPVKFSETEKEVLDLLTENYCFRFSRNQIAKECNLEKAAVFRILQGLSKKGMIMTTKSLNDGHLVYSINKWNTYIRKYILKDT